MSQPLCMAWPETLHVDIGEGIADINHAHECVSGLAAPRREAFFVAAPDHVPRYGNGWIRIVRQRPPH